MPGKSRHRRGRYIVQAKKKKGKRNPITIMPQQEIVTPSDKTDVITSKLSSPIPTKAGTEKAAIGYQELIIDLRRIGILFGIILAILIVLFLVL